MALRLIVTHYPVASVTPTLRKCVEDCQKYVQLHVCWKAARFMRLPYHEQDFACSVEDVSPVDL
jgi:hypothetical protein